jgi:hypothetical protein
LGGEHVRFPPLVSYFHLSFRAKVIFPINFETYFYFYKRG